MWLSKPPQMDEEDVEATKLKEAMELLGRVKVRIGGHSNDFLLNLLYHGRSVPILDVISFLARDLEWKDGVPSGIQRKPPPPPPVAKKKRAR